MENTISPKHVRSDIERKYHRNKAWSIIGTWVLRIVFILIALTIIVPILFMLMNTFKTNAEYYADIWSWPTRFSLDNYKLALEYTNLLQYALNTIFIVVLALALNLVLSTSISYCITRFKSKMGPMAYRYFLFGMLVPQVLAIIPLFLVARFLGLYNTRLILIFAYAAFNMPFAVFTMCAFFKTIPKDLEEAASIDGANYTQTFIRIMVPLVKPSLITVGVFNFLEMWNEYLLALTLISDESKKTVSLAALRIQAAQGVRADWGAMFACAIMIMLPVCLVYAIFQRKLVEGLTAGSLKG